MSDVKKLSSSRIETVPILNLDLIPEINEVYLFHGASSADVDHIIEDGLDTRVSGNRLLFGQGIYFSDNPTKADEYVKDDTKGQIILCRVLLGNVFTGSGDLTNLKRGPCLKCQSITKCSQHKRVYDSVLGEVKPDGTKLKFKEFVIYKNELCYPEFVIEYVKP